jgi:nucleoside 2-deoxyribosyltransferase
MGRSGEIDMMKQQVYLAGPITGLDYEGSTDWREKAKSELAKFDVRGLSPMRGKEYLKALGVLSCTGEEYAHLSVISNSRGVMTRDRCDATRCDVLLVNLLGAKSVSVGTVMEVAWADLKRIPIVVAIEAKGNPHEHMMLSEAYGYRVPSLDEALHIVKLVLDVKVAA